MRSRGKRRNLVGYLVLGTMPTPNDLKEIRRFLQSKLPDYMVPSALAVLDKLPVNTNQKVDRKALSKLHPETRPSWRSFHLLRTTRPTYKLVAIWKSLLEIPSIGVRRDFFSGHPRQMKFLMIVKIEKGLRQIPSR